MARLAADRSQIPHMWQTVVVDPLWSVLKLVCVFLVFHADFKEDRASSEIKVDVTEDSQKREAGLSQVFSDKFKESPWYTE